MRVRSFIPVVLALLVIDGLDYSQGQVLPSISLALTSPVDVTSGDTVCMNARVELTCIGTSITFLTWLRNGVEIDSVSLSSSLGRRQAPGGFLVFLDVLSTADNMSRMGNMTSRLIFNVSDVSSGDAITCTEIGNVEGSETLNYMNRSAPRLLQASNYTMILLPPLMLSVSFNPTFTTVHDVTSYKVRIADSSTAICPSVCLPNEICQCAQLSGDENVTISISAINCGDQEGPATILEAQARLPSPPSECLGLPVYNYTSDLTGIYFHWMRVDDPPEFTTGVPQNITHYSVSVMGDTAHTIPATTACPAVSCSYLFPINLSFPISPFRGDVSASNVIGPGPSCFVQMEVDSSNQVFSLRISSTNPTNQTVECSARTGTIGTFDCEFCYNPLSSCQSTIFSSCQVITESFSLSLLNELTYCYRATARINGRSVAVIQGNFSTACLPQDLGVDQPSNVSSGIFPIFGGRVSYNGTTEGAVATYQCDGGYSLSGNVERVCQSDGNWNGQVPQCTVDGISVENIVFLVLSLVLWILSLLPAVTETVLFILVTFKKLFTEVRFLRWQKAVYITVLILAVVLLVIVFILWIVFAAAVGKPSKISQRDCSIIAAFVLSLLNLLLLCALLVFIVIKKYKSSTSIRPQNPPQEGNSRKIKEEESLYDHPNGQGASTNEKDEHRGVSQNVPKKKNIKVKKKAKQEKIEMDTQQEYDTLKGEGRHIDTLKDTPDPPCASPIQGQYGKLNMEGGDGREQYTDPYDSLNLRERYEMMPEDQPKSSTSKKGKTSTKNSGGAEYAVVDKLKKKAKRTK